MQEVGGSIEDLWPFNEEITARAIYNSKIPIISAVGHETDFTIADFVADLRAPTPSAAAELAVPDIEEIKKKIETYNQRYKISLKKKIEFMKMRYQKCMASKAFTDPTSRIKEEYIKLDLKIKEIENLIITKVKDLKNNAIETIAKLDTLSPLKTLTRGYIIAQKEGKVLKSIKDLEPDIIITCAYGQILPQEILDIPRLGCINVHASLLPKLRGGAPIHRAIMEGYQKTGITIMYMNSKMDEGDIISFEEIEITKEDTASTLHDKLSQLGKELLLKTLPSIINGTNERIKQDSSLATYAFTIKREDEKIDFSKTKRQIYNQVRGLNSYPGAYAIFETKILKIWECYESTNFYPELLDGQITRVYKDGIGVKVGNGEIVLTVVQPEGKGKMKATDFARGLVNKGSIEGKILS